MSIVAPKLTEISSFYYKEVILALVLRGLFTCKAVKGGKEIFTIQSLSDEACDHLWHQGLIYCDEHTLKDIHQFLTVFLIYLKPSSMI